MFPLNAAAATRQEAILLTDDTITYADTAPGGARIISGIRINANGNLERVFQWDLSPAYAAIHQPAEWNDLKTNMQNYEAQATSPDIVDFGDALGVWIPCSSSPEWAAQRGPAGSGTTTAAITVQIRHINTGIVKTSALFTCQATEL
jgi:hypothetical protein